jgi:hypothetical protein
LATAAADAGMFVRVVLQNLTHAYHSTDAKKTKMHKYELTKQYCKLIHYTTYDDISIVYRILNVRPLPAVALGDLPAKLAADASLKLSMSRLFARMQSLSETKDGGGLCAKKVQQ